MLKTIQELSTTPRHEGDEYEYTSDFLEWFYYNLCKNNVEQVTNNPEFECMREECMSLLNVNNAKNFDDLTLTNKYENMKQWLLNIIAIE